MSTRDLDSKLFSEEYPFASHFFDLGEGLRMHYLDEGPRDAEPLIFIHGNPTWSFLYRRWIKLLSRKYRVIVPDHIGCGFSDKPSAAKYSYRLDQRITDLAQLLSRLGLQKDLTFFLHDWGGFIGMGYATRHPDQMKRFVVFNTGAFLAPPKKAMPWSLGLARVPGLGPFLNQGFNAFGRIASDFYWFPEDASSSRLSALRRLMRKPYAGWEDRIAIQKFVEDIPMKPEHPSYQTLKRIDENLFNLKEKPMQICWGEGDFVFDEIMLEEWIRRFPKAQLKRVPSGGHYILENAFSQIEPSVVNFLEHSRS